MAISLLIAAGPGVTGKWVRVEPAKSVDYPMRLQFVGASWAADNVIIEELVGGLPGNGNSPYPPSSDTGSVVQVAQVGPNSGDLTIEAPIDFIRARTGANMTGTVSVFATMSS
jgi:hypothetical protein